MKLPAIAVAAFAVAALVGGSAVAQATMQPIPNPPESGKMAHHGGMHHHGKHHGKHHMHVHHHRHHHLHVHHHHGMKKDDTAAAPASK